MTHSQLAKEYNIGKATIHYIVNDAGIYALKENYADESRLITISKL
jgi:hypothetical protein